MRRANVPTRRGFTLIEAVIVIVALAIMVPPSIAWLNRAGHDRVDAVNATRATFLATSVLEQVLADAASTGAGLGFAAFADAPAYLDTPATGLRDRLAPVTAPYAAMGMSYSVAIGPLVTQAGAVSGDAAQDVFRVVTVTVNFPASYAASAHSVSMSSMVGDI